MVPGEVYIRYQGKKKQGQGCKTLEQTASEKSRVIIPGGVEKYVDMVCEESLMVNKAVMLV